MPLAADTEMLGLKAGSGNSPSSLTSVKPRKIVLPIGSSSAPFPSGSRSTRMILFASSSLTIEEFVWKATNRPSAEIVGKSLVPLPGSALVSSPSPL
jgi:hypothetical protein